MGTNSPEYMRAWRAAHPRSEAQKATDRAINAAWHAANPESAKRAKARWRANRTPERVEKDRARFRRATMTPEQIVAANMAMASYDARNPDKMLARAAKRRASRRERTPSWYGELDEFVMQEAAALALSRTERTGFKWEVDHIVPLCAKHVSGLHCAANLQVIPATENRKKGNNLVDTRYVFGIALPADANQAG